MRSASPTLAFWAVLAALVLPAAEAAAQGNLRSAAPRSGDSPAVRAPPPALPGLQGREAPEPIPPDPDANLGPNEALFDAINRNDLGAARAAVARGADIRARNVLGLTPLESAVDQGRTEIVFFLLSVRGGAPARAAPPATEAGPAPAPPPRTAARPAPAARPAAAPAEAPLPRLWAGDGGSPIPEIGFLGFDAGRPAGAAPPAEAARPAGRGRS
ncbi:ankyrin repeat domain-containing protein [Crenalkalicoccus roseus]|uniref:ankyrin repeat domain-containing protein n=1 Tax=Crenalkalicoccus roseus TaxID=1485588 RepID=UPI001081F402|nr:ankyrin repeat domain-containing protein [Crenalkalicoccus roseus]